MRTDASPINVGGLVLIRVRKASVRKEGYTIPFSKDCYY